MSQTAQIQNTNTNTELSNFINTLVQAIIGYSIEEIPADNRLEIVQDCIKLFSQYIIDFVSQKYGVKEGIRLKASQQFASQNIFAKFADLGDKFDEAYDSFIEVLKQDIVGTTNLSNLQTNTQI